MAFVKTFSQTINFASVVTHQYFKHPLKADNFLLNPYPSTEMQSQDVQCTKKLIPRGAPASRMERFLQGILISTHMQ